VEEMVTGQHARENGFVATFDHRVVGPITMPTVPLSFSSARYEASPSSPAYGEHSMEVLQGLGLSTPEVEALIREGVIGVPKKSPFS
jgi:crotonobetainyl-CoA:carnitine CoA-transferase CaiB-like acyl-CoA transferase